MAAAKAALGKCMGEMKKIFPQATESQVNTLIQDMQGAIWRY
jgi:hypothetical protein